MADINLQIGQLKTAGFVLIDNVTLQQINGTFSNQTILSNSNPQFATFSIGANPNYVNATGVQVGSGTVVISLHADYTDAGNGTAQSQDFTITKTFTVIGNPNGAHPELNFP